MNPSASDAESVLHFWRDLEVFNIPSAPSSKDNTEHVKVDTFRNGSVLPWQNFKFRPTEQHGYVHVVYVGCADMEDLSRILLRAIFPDQDLSQRECERATGRGWLAAFVVNEHGYPKLDSYLPASFAHGVDALRHSEPLENVKARLIRASQEFAQRRHELAPHPEGPEDSSDCSDPPSPIGWEELNDELNRVRQLLGVGAEAPTLDWRVTIRTARVARRKLEDSLDAAIDFLNSFYLDDLNRLIMQRGQGQPFGKALTGYLGQPLSKDKRIDILTRHDAMGELVSVAGLPSARWPASSKTPLVLAQQAAVAHTLHTLGNDGGILGVNGPPGTGKTTLLCDVIAEVITQRARRLADLNRPIDLFDDTVSIGGKNFFPLKQSIVAGSSIVVTSTNNNAVKNITLTLPAREKVAQEFAAASYFDEVAREVFLSQKVLGEDDQPVECWGMVSAALGNAGNRRSFAWGFFRDKQKSRKTEDESEQNQVEEPKPTQEWPPMRQLLEAAYDDYTPWQREWQAGKKTFLSLVSEFDTLRGVLLLAEKAALRMDECRSRLDTHSVALAALTVDVAQCNRDVVRCREHLTLQHAVVTAAQATWTQHQLQCQPNAWDRLCSWLGRESARMAGLRASLSAPTQTLNEATVRLSELAVQGAQADARLDSLLAKKREQEAHQQVLQRELLGHQRALKAGHDTGAKHFPDNRLWASPSESRHRASVAVSEKLDNLRALIFLQALDLHRLTILANAGKFIANLRAVNDMLRGSRRDQVPLDQRPRLWDAFFFVVPVVSTTLASFDRLFAGMGQDSLGWLLVDEAGQATPQSAAGAIWRSQRAVLVGDPLQVEPVFTVPLRLVEEFRRRHGVDTMWSPKDESVQTLADRITPFGSWVAPSSKSANIDDDEQSDLWTGMPLRTHRRCDDPMFMVANRIAYAGQMVRGKVDASGHAMPTPFSCALGQSSWLDVQAQHHEHPVVEEELDALLQCLRQLQKLPAFTPASKPDEKDKPAKIFVISPFRKVKNACIKLVKEARITGVDCGTIHTFQGREAEIVFLVLGTSPGPAGDGARNWASSKPNLLNVAITRAKHRLYVIGDAEAWGRLDHFSELLKELPTRPHQLDKTEQQRSA